MTDDYNFFVTIVADEHPKELMQYYDKNLKVKPYVVYKYEDAGLLKQRYITMCNALLNNKELSEDEISDIKLTIESTSDMTDDDFYFDYVSEYTIDPKTGNAISDLNKDGKWSMFQDGKLFSVPFITLDGREVFQARKYEIDWSKMHLAGQEIYKRAWEMVMENSKPQNDNEQIIYDNMKNRTMYFSKFKTKENYVIHSTAFWGYAFLSEKTGWKELEEYMNQFDWVSHFYDNFIKPLDENTLLTIFECKK